jgi:hypothetical protein
MFGRPSPFIEQQDVPPRTDKSSTFPLYLDSFHARLAAGEDRARSAFGLETG